MAPIVNVTQEIVTYVSPRSKPSAAAGVAVAIPRDREAVFREIQGDIIRYKSSDIFDRRKVEGKRSAT